MYRQGLVVLAFALGFLGCSLNDPPTITGVSPTAGPQAGGTTVTIQGTNFTDHTRVGIGGREAHVVSTIDSGALTVVTPSHDSLEAVDVVVRNRDGQKDKLRRGFTYSNATTTAASTVTIASIAPPTGVAGNTVTITGSGFETGATVVFLSAQASNISVLSSTQIQCVVPPGSGTVTVVVTNPDGGQAQTSWTYQTGTTPTLPPGGGSGRTITTTAGGATPGFSGDGGNATAALLANPSGLAIGFDGTLYVADTGNDRVRSITVANIITTIAGTGTAGFAGDGGTATSAQLSSPRGLAVDASANVYIADAGNHAVRLLTGGLLTTYAGTLGTAGTTGDGGAATAALLSATNAVALDSSGNLYVCDTGNDRVRAIDAAKTITAFAGTGVSGFSGDGAAAVSAQLSAPSGVIFEARSSRVYISDSGNSRVRFVDLTAGTIATYAGGGTGADGSLPTAASLAIPIGLVIDTTFHVLYIADSGAQKVRSVATTASPLVIQTLAGNGTAGFTGDGGPATSAELAFPAGVAANATGGVFIADSGDGSVRFVR